MFDIGWSEMAIILLVALIVIGPKDLPRVARNVGRWVGKGRAMAREFQRALEDMAKEAELDTVKQEIEKAARTDIGKTIEKSIDPKGELGNAFDPGVSTPARPAAKPALPGGATSTGEAPDDAGEAAADEAFGPPPSPPTVGPGDSEAKDRQPAPAEPR